METSSAVLIVATAAVAFIVGVIFANKTGKDGVPKEPVVPSKIQIIVDVNEQYVLDGVNKILSSGPFALVVDSLEPGDIAGAVGEIATKIRNEAREKGWLGVKEFSSVKESTDALENMRLLSDKYMEAFKKDGELVAMHAAAKVALFRGH